MNKRPYSEPFAYINEKPALRRMIGGLVLFS
nr:MAG TPA: hypothetical protein [Caudoviricetes sp.]